MKKKLPGIYQSEEERNLDMEDKSEEERNLDMEDKSGKV